MRGARASSRLFTVKVMSLACPSNGRDLCWSRATRAMHTRRNFSRAYCPNAGYSRGAGLKHGSDEEIMTRLAAGDPAALRELYEKHGRALLRFSAAMCRSRQSAEDLVHDT